MRALAQLADMGAMTAGPSMDEHTDVCAMINLGQAERVEAWVREAERAPAFHGVG